ncbi:glycosyltransferase family 4 protein [Psychromonas antarctica]|uniref:glycosyltransferase family 4 protein n=1 Tax=Psychromonas antarctica TaxID=67573 RepID=UPI001EE98D8B|nr:glycosyltransferase family 4 protein [Psychromonas antarctica]MCG6201914.1 glycosyltransferase family 4 protein [Psychromonas antarctica]
MEKIILSTYTFLPDIGGVATNTLTIAEAFIAKGYDVTVVTLTTECCEYDNRMKIVRAPNFLQLVKLYLSADWILFSNLSTKLCWPAVLINKKFALHHHSSSAFNNSTPSGVIQIIKRLIENKVSAKSIHFVNSEFTKKDGGAFFDNLKTYLTYPIVQNTKVTTDIVDIYASKKNALFVGRIETEKGVSFLLENFEFIKKYLNIDSLSFAGDGSLLKSLKEKNIKGIEFVGAVDLTTVHQMMRKSAYVLIPSIWNEPFGMVAVEGLASGSVVISSDKGGLPEAVGNHAALFDFDSTESFIDALKEAESIRERCIVDSERLLNYVESVNEHMDAFSKSNVINIMINALME